MEESKLWKRILMIDKQRDIHKVVESESIYL